MGLMAILATVAMLFAAFTAAVLIRRTGGDWEAVPLPPLIWGNTAVLIMSSVAVERARGAARRDQARQSARWLAVASSLGVLFVAGQVAAWRLLVVRGVVLPSSAYASFFYMLSAVHGAHVVGGLGALGWTLRRAGRGAYRGSRQAGLAHTAIYWHFVGGVWLYLVVLLLTL